MFRYSSEGWSLKQPFLSRDETEGVMVISNPIPERILRSNFRHMIYGLMEVTKE